MDREVSRFTWAAFVHDAGDGVVGVEKRTSRHALRELLLDLDKLHTMPDGK